MKYVNERSVIGISFIVALLIIGAISLLSYLNAMDFIRNRYWVQQTYRVLSYLDDVNESVLRIESTRRWYAIAGLEASLKYPLADVQRTKDEVDSIRVLVVDNEIQRIRADSLVVLVNREIDFAKKAFDVREKSDPAGAAKFIGTGDGNKLIDNVHNVIEAMKTEELSLLGKRDVELEINTRNTFLTFSVGLALSFVFLISAFFRLNLEATKQKKSEDKIRELSDSFKEQLKKAEAINKELESFTYSVSHDLKAPLRGIDGYSRILLEEYHDKLDDEGKRFLQNIRSAAEQMDMLINDLLHYSRLERRAISPEIINPAELVQNILREFSAETNERAISISVDIPFQSITTDSDSLTQALRNLIGNAIKFTRKVSDPKIEIGGLEMDKMVRLWVRDNGIGFDMKYHERIFEIFQRLQRAEDYPGTGIGLAIVHKAVERMKGRVWAESEPGKGATFYMEIPRAL